MPDPGVTPNEILLGYESPIRLKLSADKLLQIALLIAGVTRVVWKLAGVTLDSSSNPERFDLRRLTEGVIDIDLSSIPFPAGTYLGRLIIHSPAFPKGVVAMDRIKLLIGR